MQVGETAIYELGVPADAVDEILNFVAFRISAGKYVPYSLMNIYEALGSMVYGEAHAAAMADKEGVHYGLPEDS